MIPRLSLALMMLGTATLHAQITPAEYAARRDSLSARIGDGVVIAFGGRTPITDFGPFYQLPAFRYLTGYEYADAALVMVVRGGRGSPTLFVHRSTPRRSLYYGAEPDSGALARDLRLPSRTAAGRFTRSRNRSSGGGSRPTPPGAAGGIRRLGA